MTGAVAVTVFLALLLAYALHHGQPPRGRYRVPVTHRSRRTPVTVTDLTALIDQATRPVYERIDPAQATADLRTTHPDLIALDRHMDEIRRAWARRGQ